MTKTKRILAISYLSIFTFFATFLIPVANAGPLAPTSVSVSITGFNANSSGYIRFLAPTNTANVIGYKYSTDGGSSWRVREDSGGLTSPLTFTRKSSSNAGWGQGAANALVIRLCAVLTGETNTAGTTSTTCGDPGNAITATPGTPNEPTNVTASQADQSLVVSFTAPTLDGGSAITNYEYSLDGTTWTALSPVDTTSPITIPNLVNGTTYSVLVRAVNANGSGGSSYPAATGTPRIGQLSIPILRVQAGESDAGALDISWSAVSNATRYLIRVQDVGNPSSVFTYNVTSTKYIALLGRERSYRVSIKAIGNNNYVDSLESPMSHTVTTYKRVRHQTRGSRG